MTKPPNDARLTERTEAGTQQPFEVREGERERVAELARFCTSRQIGLLLRGVAAPISHMTIQRHFESELQWGKANMLSQAGGKLIDAVLAGKESSIHFYLKTQGDPGQFVERREHSGPGGGPIPVLDVAALAHLTDEQLESLGNLASRFAELVSSDDTDGVAAVPDAT